MIVVNNLDTTHIIQFIPRVYDFGTMTLKLTKEGFNQSQNVLFNYVLSNGFMVVTFDFDFM